MQLTSVAPQEVALATASLMQGTAQEGMVERSWAVARVMRAARTGAWYFIFGSASGVVEGGFVFWMLGREWVWCV